MVKLQQSREAVEIKMPGSFPWHCVDVHTGSHHDTEFGIIAM